MSYYSYNQYGKMSTDDKNHIWDANGEMIAEKFGNAKLTNESDNVLYLNNPENISNSWQPFKTQPISSTSYIGDNSLMMMTREFYRGYYLRST